MCAWAQIGTLQYNNGKLTVSSLSHSHIHQTFLNLFTRDTLQTISPPRACLVARIEPNQAPVGRKRPISLPGFTVVLASHPPMRPRAALTLAREKLPIRAFPASQALGCFEKRVMQAQ